MSQHAYCVCIFYLITFLLCSGRGVWRCAYDPNSSLLVTAGFDSAIKVHQLQTSPEFLGKTVGTQELSTYKQEAFELSIPNSIEHVGHMDR